jgi:hypothetical protein
LVSRFGAQFWERVHVVDMRHLIRLHLLHHCKTVGELWCPIRWSHSLESGDRTCRSKHPSFNASEGKAMLPSLTVRIGRHWILVEFMCTRYLRQKDRIRSFCCFRPPAGENMSDYELFWSLILPFWAS